MQTLYALGIGVGFGLAAILGFGIVYFAVIRRGKTCKGARTDTAAILLQDGTVVDSTEAAMAFFPDEPLLGTDWTALRERLITQFMDVPTEEPQDFERFRPAKAGQPSLTVYPDGKKLRLVIETLTLDDAETMAREAEKSWDHMALLEAVEFSPGPMWKIGPDNRISWCNAAYRHLCERSDVPDADVSLMDIEVDPDKPRSTTRINHTERDGSQHWYEVTTHVLKDGVLHSATNIDNLIEAEMAQRNFVQTLTKTFAHLPIGLAVFDRDRRLVLFNPALIDLTRLPAKFLSARPNLMSFFDHMRENQMMPEPKNYANWRHELAEVISAARNDRYCETWNLPSSLTYKITGRPHPDGAVAFLIEDISAEISLTRQFRSELALTQSVIDCFSDAVAVFSQLGVLTFCNAAYRDLWACDPDSTIAEMTILDATRDWQTNCTPSTIWVEIREFVLTMRNRAAWDAKLTMKSGTPLHCVIEPVAGGATMVRFSAEPIAEKAPTSKRQAQVT